MEIAQLRAFLAVAEELHFGRAAQRLHFAQPHLSRTIQQLEKDLGADLFVRTTRSVQLTAAGVSLVEPARAVLDACRLAELAVGTAGRGHTGRVRLGFAGSSSHVLVGRFAKLVRRTHPGIEFELDSTTYASEALAELRDGSVDLVLARWLYPPPGIATRIVLEEDVVCALPREHRLADRQALRMEELADDPWVALPAEPGSTLRDYLHRLAHDAGFAPRIVQSAPDSVSVFALVAAEVGCALTLTNVARNISNPEVVVLPIEPRPDPLQLRLAWRADTHDPAVHEVLRLSEEALPTPAGVD
ncbi:LysR substrate-binding domain-containing protein [Gordonia sp. GONU]|uniref:LysR substrate-binding domain-containing protein n=1 Tax=Gordonia sp. GONU TaxID=2972949 RepID=UPI0021AD158E|nr:LysR substrate-binding domain-containing protein [Gordonia sp. GONU]MCR8899111.1 LysR substrate-binding domain-containing protein [Gordonia sp. GONU]